MYDTRAGTRRLPIDDVQDDENELYISPSFESPNSKHRSALKGYTGCMPLQPYSVEEDHSPTRRFMIRGYSGFLSGTKDIVGVPFIPSEDVQVKKMGLTNNTSDDVSEGHIRHAGHLENKVEQSTLGSSFTNFRSYGKNMEIAERYENAITKLKKKGQTQEMLLRMVQSKLSERVNSYAHQQVRMRKIFEYFDLDGSNDLDEHEFRQFLELSNVYFDDVQSLALFAYFDEDRSGGISWESFEARAMVLNPRGGTAVIPKGITAPMDSEEWKSVGKNTVKK
jgi:Ca2+-binding EF-hand superfamily protein